MPVALLTWLKSLFCTLLLSHPLEASGLKHPCLRIKGGFSPSFSDSGRWIPNPVSEEIKWSMSSDYLEGEEHAYLVRERGCSLGGVEKKASRGGMRWDSKTVCKPGEDEGCMSLLRCSSIKAPPSRTWRFDMVFTPWMASPLSPLDSMHGAGGSRNPTHGEKHYWPPCVKLPCSVLSLHSWYSAWPSSKIKVPPSPTGLGLDPEVNTFGYCFSHGQQLSDYNGREGENIDGKIFPEGPNTSHVLGIFNLHKTLKLLLFSTFHRQEKGSTRGRAQLQMQGSNSCLVPSTTLIRFPVKGGYPYSASSIFWPFSHWKSLENGINHLKVTAQLCHLLKGRHLSFLSPSQPCTAKAWG